MLAYLVVLFTACYAQLPPYSPDNMPMQMPNMSIPDYKPHSTPTELPTELPTFTIPALTDVPTFTISVPPLTAIPIIYGQPFGYGDRRPKTKTIGSKTGYPGSKPTSPPENSGFQTKPFWLVVLACLLF